MRIIGGSAKRRGLKTPSAAQGVRPILGRIKKSLFDILQLRIGGATFLDLYAGSGAVGIEALSRGAASVTFVDRNPTCLHFIRQNLASLSMERQARLVKADAVRGLSMVGGRYDLIFMGPPYKDLQANALSLTQPTLEAVGRAALLNPETWVICQHHAKEPEVTLSDWKMIRQEDYGDSRLSFFTYEPTAKT